MERLVNWIEIPVTDMRRAKAFYESVLGATLVDAAAGDREYALFPTQSRTNAGALVRGAGVEPSARGAVIYLDGSRGFDALLDRVARAGGEVLVPKTRLSEEAGDVALFLDSEGNKIGVQAMPERAESVSDAEMRSLLAGAPPRFAFVLTPGPEHGPHTMALQWEHARNMFTLLRRGVLHTVTALMDGTDVLGVGTLEAPSKAAAEEILARDPAVKGGRLVARVFSAGSFVRGEV